MKRGLMLGLSLLSISLASPAIAGASADFSGCDGLRKPKAKDDGMRGNATMTRYGLNSFRNIVVSCNRALERKQLKDSQNLRRAHLLRARAAAYVAQKNSEAALIDLDAAEAELHDYRGKFFFDRSMGISLDLLRAIALSEAGNGQEALGLAKNAIDARPYSLPIQMVATILIDRHAPKGTDRGEIWQNLTRIEPQARAALTARTTAILEPSAKFARIAEQASDEPLEFRSLADVLGLGSNMDTRQVAQWVGQYSDALHLSYALAAAGQTEQARLRLAEVKVAVGLNDDALPEQGNVVETESAKALPETTPDDGGRETEPSVKTPAKPFGAIEKTLMDMVAKGTLRTRMTMIDARLALASGEPENVSEILGDEEYPASDMAKELHAAYAQYRATSDIDLPDLTPLGPAPENSLRSLSDLARVLLIAPEDERQMIDYKKSRPDVVGGLLAGALSMGISLLGGFDRTEGFQSEEQEDGTTKVEFIGSSSSASVVQEMTLLRAAEIAREAGQSHFVIDRRQDFERYLANTFQRTLNGYKTILFVSYPEDAHDSSVAIDAVQVIDTLGPIYYGDG